MDKTTTVTVEVEIDRQSLKYWETINTTRKNDSVMCSLRVGEFAFASLSWGEMRPVPHELLLARRSPVPSHPGEAREG